MVYRLFFVLTISIPLSACIRDAPPQDSEASTQTVAPVRSNVEIPVSADRTFETGRVGAIVGGMTMARVEQLYGPGSVVSRQLNMGEGGSRPGYAIFPGTPDELLVSLDEDNTAATVRIGHPQSRWRHADTDLTVGTPLHELARMNGRPFEFRGWGWDYGGTVTNWKSGKLTGIRVRLTYDGSRLGPEGPPEEILGDVPVMSDAEVVANLGVEVGEVSVDL